MSATPSADRQLPTGTVTFLFSDIQGSTRLLHELGNAYAEVLAEHRRVLRAAFAAHNGVEVGTEGDSFFVAFARASDAVAAATNAQCGLVGGPAQVRMGLHVGEPLLTAEGYVGMVVHRAARIAAAAHGGQVLVSQAVADLVADRLPFDAGLRDLGSVRLKDLGAPEHIYQITHPQLRESFPALRSLEATPNNLPQQTTSFVGREREIAAIKTLLAGTRLLTLTGSGGSGKTRLSLHVAADVLEQFRDGAWLMELAALADPSLLPQTVATVLGVKEEPGRPVLDTLSAHLKARNVLLLIDNCEHLLDGCAKLSDALLRQCPEVTIVATSREALGIAGEQIYRVPSLSVPDQSHAPTPQSLSMYESVQLFIDRALLVRPEFKVTNRNAPALASLCHHLDGLPLAIELAAARVRSLSVEEIDGRLDQRFRLLTGASRTALPRHQTLRALIDWSYDLLRDSEQLLLQRLSVFAGGWTLEAAEAVCTGEGVDGIANLDLLTSLADKSLVMVDQSEEGSRYWMLESVRQYVREKMAERGGDDLIRQQHREYFLALAEEADSNLSRAQQVEWLQRLDKEQENLRTALEWSLATGSKVGLRLCGALRTFWLTRGYLAEGRSWCARILEGAGAEDTTADCAKVLNAAGALATYQADYPAAMGCLKRSLAIGRQLGDLTATKASLVNLGNVALEQGDYPSARSLYEESLVISRDLGDLQNVANTLHNLGTVAFYQSDYLAARLLNIESLAIWREMRNHAGVGLALDSLGLAAFGEGDCTAARGFYEESLAIARERGDLRNIAIPLSNLGVVALHQGDLPLALAFHEESLAIERQLGNQRGIASDLCSLGQVKCEQGDFPAAAPLHRDSLVIRREVGDREGIAASLSSLAELFAGLGKFLCAARAWGTAERLRAELGSVEPPIEQTRQDRSVAAARTALEDDAAFDRAWQEGRAMTLDQAMELALEQTLGQRPQQREAGPSGIA